MSAKKPITAASMTGRVLLAMRPGAIEHGALTERFGYRIGSVLTGLVTKGLVERADDGYSLTEVGRTVCPSRRSTCP